MLKPKAPNKPSKRTPPPTKTIWLTKGVAQKNRSLCLIDKEDDEWVKEGYFDYERWETEGYEWVSELSDYIVLKLREQIGVPFTIGYNQSRDGYFENWSIDFEQEDPDYEKKLDLYNRRFEIYAKRLEKYQKDLADYEIWRKQEKIKELENKINQLK